MSIARVCGPGRELLKWEEYEAFMAQWGVSVKLCYAEGQSCRTCRYFDEGSLPRWCIISYYLDGGGEKIKKNVHKSKESAEVCTIVAQRKHLEKLATEPLFRDCLEGLVKELLMIPGNDRNVQMVVIGSHSRKKKVDEKAHKFRQLMNGSKKGSCSQKDPSATENLLPCTEDSDDALLELQLDYGINFYYCADTSNYLKWLTCVFKASLTPEQLTENQKLARNNIGVLERTGSQKIGKNEERWVERTWVHQLRQLQTIDEDTANSIAKIYPSMNLLRKAIIEKSPDYKFLENLTIEKGFGVLATRTTLGASAARQIIQVLTSLEPEEFLL